MTKKTWVSFDCWETILRGNPVYRPLRNKILHEVVFPELDMDDEEFQKLVKNAKDFSDYSNEGLGEQLSAHQSMLSVVLSIDKEKRPNKQVVAERFKEYDKQHEKMFMDTLPPIYSEETLEVLKVLYEKRVVMNLSCNTSFINGLLLFKAFRKHGLDKYFLNYTFSDQIGYSKPSPDFFHEVHMQCDAAPVEEIIHVGDNPFSDGGSIAAGIDFLYINGTSGKTISEVLNYV